MSAQTARLAATPSPWGSPAGPGLWRHKNWALPNYVEQVSKGIMKSGRARDESEAIHLALGVLARWARGGGKVRPEVRAAAAKAIAEFQALKARAASSHSHSVQGLPGVELASAVLPDQPRVEPGQPEGGQYDTKPVMLSRTAFPDEIAAAVARMGPAQRSAFRRTSLAPPGFFWAEGDRLKAHRAAGASLSGQPRRVIELVGPKGYIHGWIFVGIPVRGAHVFHPQHGAGIVTGHHGGQVSVRFSKGGTRSFQHAPARSTGKLVPRTADNRAAVGVALHETLPGGSHMTVRNTAEGEGSTAHIVNRKTGTTDTLTVSGLNGDGYAMVRHESRSAGDSGRPSVTTSRISDLSASGGDLGAAASALLPARNRMLDKHESAARDRLASHYGTSGVHFGSSMAAGRAATQLDRHVPAAMHERLSNNGWSVHAPDGPVTDVLTELRGAHSPTHDASHPGGHVTWDQVQGVTDFKSRKVIIGHDARAGTALHEAAHALDFTHSGRASAGDTASRTPAFAQIYHDAMGSKSLYPYYRPRSGADGTDTGRSEFFAESFGTWLKHRTAPAATRQAEMSAALSGGQRNMARVKGMAKLDAYYRHLYGKMAA